MNENIFFKKEWRGQNIRILAVDDPAVGLYQNGHHVTDQWEKITGMKVAFEPIQWSEYPAKVFSMLQSGSDAYDSVMVPGFFWLPKFASSKWVAPLDPLIDSIKEAWQAYQIEDVHPHLRIELSYLDKKYLIPSFSEVQIVYYRKDLIRDAGLETPKNPISINDYIMIAEKLHHPPDYYGTHIKGGTAESFPEWLPFFSSFGGDLFDGVQSPSFNNVAGIKSLQIMKALVNYCGPNVEQGDNATVLSLLKSGKVGIVNHWSGQLIPAMRERENGINEDYGFTFLENPWGSIWAFALNSASKKQIQTLSYLLYATCKENDIRQADYSGSPVRLSTLANPTLQFKYPWFDSLSGALDQKSSFPSFERFADIVGNLYLMVNDVLSGKKEISEALLQAENTCK